MPRIREEITVWDKCPYEQPNHIYITSGTYLIGYIPKGQKKAVYFKSPKKTWSPTRRKFRDLTKRELKEYDL
jgi:hypothetical protein